MSQEAHADPPAAQPQYPIESVDRALRLLLMFRDERELRVSAVREALGVGQSTAHRLLAMLVAHRFATQDPETRAYLPGPALAEVGLAVVQGMTLRAAARRTLEHLAADTGETVHLGLLEGGSVRFVDGVESERALRVGLRVGRTLPLHATSVGKAMLAGLPEDTVKNLYTGARLPAVTSCTVTRRTDLLRELTRVREHGFASSHEESEDGVGSTGVAIQDPAGAVLGGLSVAAPMGRLSPDVRHDHAMRLQDAARAVAEALRA